MPKSSTILRLMAALFVAGGLVRLIAGQRIFALGGIGELWVDDAYFVYIYKVLGAFVILTGLLLWSVSSPGKHQRSTLAALKWGMALVGLVMLAGGWAAGLPLVYYAPDFIFAFAVALLLHRVQAKRSQG